MNRPVKLIFLTIFTVLMLLVAINAVGGGNRGLFERPKIQELKASEFDNLVRKGSVQTADWQGAEITGKLKDGTSYVTRVVPPEAQAAGSTKSALAAAGVEYDLKDAPASSAIGQILLWLLMPVLFVLLFYFFIVRPAQSGGNQALSFGRSRAKRVGETGPKITFEDVAGIEEAKQELFEIVDYLKNTKKYVQLGAKIPKGILLTGPPGVGKTHLARAISGEAGVPFFHISGSDFVEMFVGVGAARVRDLFETAKAHRPCLIFVDEIDAVGRQRGAGLGGGHDEREQTLNQLLVEMDGFDANTGVIMIAATNRPDVLDPALLRPGRFDRQLVVDPPDAKGREAILKIHAKGKPLDSGVDLNKIALRTPGFTGADLANTLNESALLAARRNYTKITHQCIEDALDRVMAGPERKSRIIDPKERELIAYHEAGHAIVGEVLEGCDPVHKVTILPRGMSLGSTWSIPEQDKYLTNEQELLDDITMSLGGRETEDLIYGTVWTGSSSDLDRVTRIARAMVCQYGMSKRLGTLVLGRRSSNPFLGRDYMEEQNYSEEIAKLIDEEVHQIVEKCRQRCREILTERRETLDRLAQSLLDRETLNREEFLAVMNNQPLPERPEPPIQQPPIEESRESDKSSTKLAPPRFEPGPA